MHGQQNIYIYIYKNHLQHRASLSVFSALTHDFDKWNTGLCLFSPHIHSDLNGTALIRTFSL